MGRFLSWVRTNKVATVFAVLLFIVLFRQIVGRPRYSPIPMLTSVSDRSELSVADAGVGIAAPMMEKSYLPPIGRQIPPSDSTDRLVQRSTSISLKVDDVSRTIGQIEATAVAGGGYLVDSNLSVPDGASSGSISIRVPAEKRTEVLSSIRSLGVKVVSEYVSGQDVTDQFVDNEERLRILESTKTKFEAILAEAKNVSEMLNVQQQLLSLQQQIDSIKGQQKYLEGSAKLTRISVYLSTDELALPYAPDNSWRPSVVAKEAVRSLILNLRGVVSALIWVGVYVPVWGSIVVLLYILKRRADR